MNKLIILVVCHYPVSFVMFKTRQFMKHFYFSLWVLFLSKGVFGQILINEYSASNLRTFTDNYGRYEDWIEIYNASDDAVNLGGWFLSDKVSKPEKWKIKAGTIISGKSYLVVWASGRDEAKDDHNHTNFKFTQSNDDEYIVISNPNGNIVESVKMGFTQLGHSFSKVDDGSNNWRITPFPTPGWTNNDSENYQSYSPTPKIVTQAGFYKDSTNVIVQSVPGFTIRFTLDGSIPDEMAPVLPALLTIRQSAVLSVRCFSSLPNILPGFVDFSSFFINEPASTLPVISIGAGPDGINLAEGNRDLKPVGSIEVYDKNGLRTSTSYGELDSHGQDSWINDQRSLDWISRDEMGYSSGIKQKLFNYTERENYQRIILRASGDDNYPSVGDEDHEGSAHIRDEFVHTLVQQSGMHMDVRALERVLLYLNGQYWGVYTIREKPDDHDYTEFTHKQDKYDLQFLKTWGQSWAEYGGEKAIQDWIKFRDKILSEDVTKPAIYNEITQQLDVVSLMDYMIANLSVVSSDWLNYNTGWWRGLNPEGSHKKWGFVMWDNDATFDYYINYSGVPDISPDAKACDLEEISLYMDEFFPVDTTLIEFGADSFFFNGEWVYYEGDTFEIYPDLGKHEKIFLKLFNENMSFRNLYLSRYADMLNVAFSCDNMMATLDSLTAIIRPEMPRHIMRWGGSMSEWESNISDLRDFVSLRCDRISNGLMDCYDLSGPHLITLVTDPPGEGDIRLNTLVHKNLPWSGKYFGLMTNEIEVIPTGSAKFLYWRSKSGNTLFDQASATLTKSQISGVDTLVAVFDNAVFTSDLRINELNVSPNPASDIISIQMPDGLNAENEFVICTSTGTKIKNGKLTDNFTSLDVSAFSPGSYIIELRYNQVKYVSKLVIVR